ncbi:MAG: hypothetical protein WCE21_05435 [Candidatus Babeliales bacterium]
MKKIFLLFLIIGYARVSFTMRNRMDGVRENLDKLQYFLWWGDARVGGHACSALVNAIVRDVKSNEFFTEAWNDNMRYELRRLEEHVHDIKKFTDDYDTGEWLHLEACCLRASVLAGSVCMALAGLQWPFMKTVYGSGIGVGIGCCLPFKFASFERGREAPPPLVDWLRTLGVLIGSPSVLGYAAATFVEWFPKTTALAVVGAYAGMSYRAWQHWRSHVRAHERYGCIAANQIAEIHFVEKRLAYIRGLKELTSVLEANKFSEVPHWLGITYARPLAIREVSWRDKEILARIVTSKEVSCSKRFEWLSKIISNDQDDHSKKALLDEFLSYGGPIEE